MTFIQIEVLLWRGNDREKILLLTTGTKYLSIIPYEYKNIIVDYDKMKLEIDIMYLQIINRYRCQGYNGYNCNFEELEQERYNIDPYSKKPVCKDINGVNNCGGMLFTQMRRRVYFKNQK